MKRTILTVSIVAAAIACWACRNKGAADDARVDALFASWSRSDTPGCTVGISRDGRVVYQHAYGMASLELGVPLAVDSVLPAASISKQFTAMSILLLAQQGKLSIDDAVRTHIPELHDFGTPLTIRHLLNHTSGMRDGFTLDGWAAPQDPWGNVNDAILRVLARQRGLNFQPGERFQYNNGAYNLLGHIVRRVSGQTLQQYADAYIFEPLGMTSTHFHDDPALIVPRRATNYWQDSTGWRVGGENGGVIGNAGLQSTVGDLLRWQENFLNPRVGNATLVAEMLTPPVLASGEKSGYALGVNVGQYRGVRIIEHGGGDRGISTYLAGYPDQKLAVAVLCNSDVIPSGTIEQRIADIYLDDMKVPSAKTAPAPAPTPVPPPAVTLTAGQLARWAGWYADEKGGLLRLTVRDGVLSVRDIEGDDTPFDLVAAAPDTFILMLGGIPVTRVAFSERTGGRDVLRVAPFGNESMPQVFQRVTGTASAAALQSLAGAYRSEELDVTYRVEARPNGLLLHPSGRPDMEVEVIDDETFAGSSAGTVRLLRDARGRVTGFTLNRTAARGVRFDRVQER